MIGGNMVFKHILRRTNRADEKITLMKIGHSEDKDELGFSDVELIPIQKLKGIIQSPQELDIDYKGEESNPQYVGYFMPEFDLEASYLANYKIKYERPYETMILKIVEYNPNLFLRHKRHHIKLGLILEKKYGKI